MNGITNELIKLLLKIPIMGNAWYDSELQHRLNNYIINDRHAITNRILALIRLDETLGLRHKEYTAKTIQEVTELWHDLHND